MRRFSVFGSAVRDDFDPSTCDIDVRVEFEHEGERGYAANYFDFREKITILFGRKVDVISGSTIRNRYFRREIEETQVFLYAA